MRSEKYRVGWTIGVRSATAATPHASRLTLNRGFPDVIHLDLFHVSYRLASKSQHTSSILKLEVCPSKVSGLENILRIKFKLKLKDD